MRKTLIALSFAMTASTSVYAQSIKLPAEALPAVTLPAPKPTSPLYRVGMLTVAAANAADIHSTLAGWKLGLHEQNALIGGNNTGRLVLVKSASVGAQLALMYALKKTGHDKAAGWVGIGASALPMFAAAHNYRLNAGR